MNAPGAGWRGRRGTDGSVRNLEVEDGERRWRCFEAAREHMVKHGHTPDSDIYAVWYAYAAHEDPLLVDKLDRSIARFGSPLPVKIIKDIHAEYFLREQEGELVRATGDKLTAELGRMLKVLESAGRDTSSFATALEKVAGKLTPEGDLRKIVETVVLATRHMEARTRRLEAELDRSSAEIRTLRQGLEAFKREAATDPLTGLYNRRAFDERLKEAAAHAIETDTELCLFLSDIDNFKKLNDSWGHQVGDAIMQLVAGAIKERLRPGDTAARFGSDEFAALLPGLSIAEAYLLADEIRELVGRKKIRDAQTGELIGQLSISGGLANYALTESVDDFIRRADMALYEAKDAGRNQVKIERVPGDHAR
jgi:diguanylate cyclase